jgi:hypothetical protein
MSFGKSFIFFLFLPLCSLLNAQDRVQLRVQIKSGKGANLADVYVKVGDMHGFTSQSGSYEIFLPPENYDVETSILGYKDTSLNFTLLRDTTLEINLNAYSVLLPSAEVLVDRRLTAAEAMRQNVQRVTVTPKRVNQTTGLLGEPDILRPLLLEPGVQSGLGGSSDLYVRGGGLYQNQLYLNGFRIFNQSHAFGFFSPIPVGSIKGMNFYKESIPVELEGALSSAMEVTLRDPSYTEWDAGFGIGLGTLRGAVSMPVFKGKSGFNVSGRVSNVGLLFNFLDTEEIDIPTRFGFNDLTAQYQHHLSDQWTIRTLFYRSSDFFGNNSGSDGFNESREVRSQNQLLGLSITHQKKAWQWRQRFYWNRYAHQFSYQPSLGDNTPDEVIAQSTIKSNLHLLGYRSTWERSWQFWKFTAGLEAQNWYRDEALTNTGGQVDTISTGARKQDLGSYRGFGSFRYSPNETWSFEGALRLRLSDHGKRMDLIPLTQAKIEYILNSRWAFFTSWDQAASPIHRYRQEQFGQAADLPFLSSPRLPAERSNQAVLGAVFKQPSWQLQTGLFYRSMQNIALRNRRASYFSVFNEDYIPGLNDRGSAFFPGKGKSYGGELGINWAAGIFAGTASYSYTLSSRQSVNIEDGRPFPFEFHHPHAASASVRVRFKKNNIDKVTEILLSYLYGSGQYTTFPMQDVAFQRSAARDFSNLSYLPRRNNVRLPPQNLLNIGINFIALKDKGRVRTFNISVSHLALSPPVFRYRGRGDQTMLGEGMFPLIPSFSYQLKF